MRMQDYAYQSLVPGISFSNRLYETYSPRPPGAVLECTSTSWVSTTTYPRTFSGAFEFRVEPDQHQFLKLLYSEATGGSNSLVKVARVICEEQNESPASEDLTVTQEMLAALRSDLSLNRSELARVLLVGRPSVYAWMSGGSIRHDNAERLRSLYEICLQWKKRSNLPVDSLVRQPMGIHKPLVELLSEPEIQRTEVLSALDCIADRMTADAAQRRENLSVRALRQLHGLSSKNRTGNSAELEAAKRGRPE